MLRHGTDNSLRSQMTAEPLRIAMVIDVWDDVANGAVASTRRFTELLRESGYTVTVLAGGVPAPGKIVLPPFTIPLADRIMRKMRFLFAWPDRGVLAAAFAEHDLVHIQMPFYLGMRAVAIAQRWAAPSSPPSMCWPRTSCTTWESGARP